MRTDTNDIGLGPVTGDQPQNDTTGIVTACILKGHNGPREQNLDNVIAVNYTKFEGLVEPVRELTL